jgi:hypothetical protein
MLAPAQIGAVAGVTVPIFTTLAFAFVSKRHIPPEGLQHQENSFSDRMNDCVLPVGESSAFWEKDTGIKRFESPHCHCATCRSQNKSYTRFHTQPYTWCLDK